MLKRRGLFARLRSRTAIAALAMTALWGWGAEAQSRLTEPKAETTILKTVVMRNVMVAMRDGTRLATDIYFPSRDGVTPAQGRFPVLLMRTPYDKNLWATIKPIVSSVDVLTPAMANGAGYVVAYQDVRGTFASEGDFSPMLHEGPDGYDTVVWLGNQTWSNGRVGTFGPSYMGGTQMMVARERPPGLVTAFSQVAATDQFKNEWVYMDGILTETAVEWTAYMLSTGGSATSRLAPEREKALGADFAALGVADPQHIPDAAFGALDLKLARALPLIDAPLVRQAPWWHTWLDNWNNRDHFAVNEMASGFDQIAMPVLHLGGWYDLFLRNTYHHYEGITAEAKDPAVRAGQRLVIGQWSHNSCRECPANAAVNTGAMQVAWMNQWMRGIKSEIFDPPVTLFVMGENRWRAEDHWPLTGTRRTRYYLHSAGRANTAAGDGVLSTNVPSSQPPDRFVYDPRDPAPSVGGPGLDGWRAAQNEVEARKDVLVYTTPVLSADVEVTGEITATLQASSSATDTDWWMKLVDVAPDGRADILTQGVARARYRRSRTAPAALRPGAIETYALDMWATSNVFKRGHRIRVEVTSSNFPYADRNPNSFVDLATATEKAFVVARQTVYHDARHVSYVELPIIPQSRPRKWIGTPFPRATQ